MSITASPPRLIPGAAAACFQIGVILYVLPTGLHGNPPIDDAAATLRYVAERDLWTWAPFANIAAVVLWAVGTGLVSSLLEGACRARPDLPDPVDGGGRRVRRVLQHPRRRISHRRRPVHHCGSRLRDRPRAHRGPATHPRQHHLRRSGAGRLSDRSLRPAARANLGRTGNRAGTILAVAVAGIIIGVGWAVGAVPLNSAVIVPFTVLSWLWFLALGVRLIVRHRPGTEPGTA